MDYTAVNREEKTNQKKGAITSFVIHIALLILAILPLLTFPDPPPGQSGVLVAFGDPELGQGDERGTPPSEEEVAEEETQEAVEEPKEIEKPKPEPPKAEPKKETPKPTKKVKTDANSQELALQKKKDADRKKKLADAAKKKAAKEKADLEMKANWMVILTEKHWTG